MPKLMRSAFLALLALFFLPVQAQAFCLGHNCAWLLARNAGVATITPSKAWTGVLGSGGAGPTTGVTGQDGTATGAPYADAAHIASGNLYKQAVIGVLDEYPYRYITTNQNTITFGGVQADDSRQDIDHVDFWFEGTTVTVRDQGVNSATKSIGWNITPTLPVNSNVGGDAKLCATAVPVNGYARTVCIVVTFDPNGKLGPRPQFYVDNSLGFTDPPANTTCVAGEGSTTANAFPSIGRAESCMNKLTSGVGGAIVSVKPTGTCYNVDAVQGTAPGQSIVSVARLVEFRTSQPGVMPTICRSTRAPLPVGSGSAKAYWALFLTKAAFVGFNIDLSTIPAIGSPNAGNVLTFANCSFTDPGGPTGATPPAGSVGPQTYSYALGAPYDGLFINTAGRYSIVDSTLVGPTIAGVHLLRNTMVNYSWDLGYFQDPNANDIGYFNVNATQTGSYYTRPHLDGWLNVTSKASYNSTQVCKYTPLYSGVTTVTSDYTGTTAGYTGMVTVSAANSNYKNEVFIFRAGGVDKPGPNLDTRTFDGQGSGIGESRTGAYSLDSVLCYDGSGNLMTNAQGTPIAGNCPVVKTAFCDPNNEMGGTLVSNDAYAVFNDLHPDVAQSGLSQGSPVGFSYNYPGNIFFSNMNLYATNTQGFFNQMMNGYDTMSYPGTGLSAAANSIAVTLTTAMSPTVAVGDKVTASGQSRYVMTVAGDGLSFTVGTAFSSSALSSVSYTRVPTLSTTGTLATLSSVPPSTYTQIKNTEEFIVTAASVDAATVNDYGFVWRVTDTTHFTLYHPFAKDLVNATVGHIPTLRDFGQVNSRFLFPLTPSSQGGTVSAANPGKPHQQAQNQAGCLHCVWVQDNFSADTAYGFWARNLWGLTSSFSGGGMEGSAFYDSVLGSLSGYSPAKSVQSSANFPAASPTYPQGVNVDGNAFNVGAQPLCGSACITVDAVGTNAAKVSTSFDQQGKLLTGTLPLMSGLKGTGKPIIPFDMTGRRLPPGLAVVGPIQP